MTITVLLADDHAVVRDGLRMILDAQADIHVVATSGDGRDAVRQTQRLRPDVALLDIAMPELNGIEAARQIRLVSPKTRTIILSMHSSEEHVYQALEAGAQGYLLKESAGADVVDAVRTVHSGRRYLGQGVSELLVDAYVALRSGQGPTRLASLSPREREVLQLLAEGRSTTEIAQTLSLSPKTVHTYKSRVRVKLGVDNLPDLVRFAIQHNLTPLE